MQRLLTVAARSRWNLCPMTIASPRRRPASFSVMMLGSTPSGDAYTFAELEGIHEGGRIQQQRDFISCHLSIQQAVISQT
jgi:hypothetical protein